MELKNMFTIVYTPRAASENVDQEREKRTSVKKGIGAARLFVNDITVCGYRVLEVCDETGNKVKL